METLIHGEADSRPPLRNSELWAAGSYEKFEKGLAALYRIRSGPLRGCADCVYSVFVRESRRHLARRLPKAQLGLAWLDANIDEAVLVPPEIAIAAGYAPADAASYAPLWAKERAA